ncbi:disulfide bond formation protein B [Erythrobacteraceae bacterium CFH 75059]|nr:disulfide bond formation protein B [Erythrobacteraceae bacterium CFH 75059]
MAGPAAGLRTAQALALLVPGGLLLGAYVAELGFGLFPCEMCWWQRYPHFAALAFGLVAGVARPARLWLLLAAAAMAVSGAIGAFHAGVEYGWWPGITGCTRAVTGGGGDALSAVLNAPLVRCDRAPWTLLGVSLAGWNFLLSLGGAAAILLLLGRTRHGGA